MPVLIKVRKNNNQKMPSCYGKYYGKTVATTTMTYRELVKHMAEHNTVYGRDVCEGVATKLEDCVLEQLLEGKKVQFGDLGTFYLSVKGTGVDNEEDYNIGVCINGLFLRFAPNRQDVNDLSSKTLKKKATLVNVKDLIESKAKKPADGEDQGGTDGGSTTDGGGTTGGNDNQGDGPVNDDAGDGPVNP